MSRTPQTLSLGGNKQHISSTLHSLGRDTREGRGVARGSSLSVESLVLARQQVLGHTVASVSLA